MKKQIVINTKRLGEVAEAAVGMLNSGRQPFDKECLFPDAVVP